MSYDLVVRGGFVVDGSGLAPYRADVAVAGRTIVEIGRLDGKGRHEVDAEGHVVTPGFIDGHTHMDAQLFWDPHGTSSCWHGVTTVVMGNCGFSLAPCDERDRALVLRNLERSEDIDARAMETGITWSWDTFASYLSTLERLPKGINYAAQVGHSALRTWSMGERAFEEAATEDDLANMANALRDAVRAGAVGFTTSRAAAHQTSDDRPVASRIASWAEVERLVGVLSELNAGVFEIAQESVFDGPQEPLDEFFARLRRLAVEYGVPTTFGIPNVRIDDQLRLLDTTNAEGGRMFGQGNCRGISIVLSFQTQLPFDTLPEWRDLKRLDPSDKTSALRDPEVRARLVNSAQIGPYRTGIAGEARPPRYEHMQILRRAVPPNATVADEARARGVHPAELMIDLAIETDLQQLFVQPMRVGPDEDLLRMLKHPRVIMTFSDSGAHVSQIMDSSIHTHMLAHWVHDRQEFRLEQAVQMMTLAPAVAWGFHDRGAIRPGMIADLNVIDPDAVAPLLPTIERDLPGGALRLTQKSTGIRATIVGGEMVHLDGDATGSLPGQLLRGPRAAVQAGR